MSLFWTPDVLSVYWIPSRGCRTDISNSVYPKQKSWSFPHPKSALLVAFPISANGNAILLFSKAKNLRVILDYFSTYGQSLWLHLWNISRTQPLLTIPTLISWSKVPSCLAWIAADASLLVSCSSLALPRSRRSSQSDFVENESNRVKTLLKILNAPLSVPEFHPKSYKTLHKLPPFYPSIALQSHSSSWKIPDMCSLFKFALALPFARMLFLFRYFHGLPFHIL